MDANIIRITYPPDDFSTQTMKDQRESGQTIHHLSVSVSDNISEPSVSDIFSSFPIGCGIQAITIRYHIEPERPFVDIQSVLSIVKSIHVISPSVSKESFGILQELINSGVYFNIRVTGTMENNLTVPEKIRGGSYVSIEKYEDHIVITSEPNFERMSKPLVRSDEELITLGVAQSLDYIKN